MAFPTKNNTDTLEGVLSRIQVILMRAKQAASGLSAAAQSPVRGMRLVRYTENIVAHRDELTTLIAVPGIGPYAESELGVTNALTELTAIRDQMTTIVTWLGANLPKTSGDYVDVIEVTTAGVVSYRLVLPGQTAGLRTELDALVALIL